MRLCLNKRDKIKKIFRLQRGTSLIFYSVRDLIILVTKIFVSVLVTQPKHLSLFRITMSEQSRDFRFLNSAFMSLIKPLLY